MAGAPIRVCSSHPAGTFTEPRSRAGPRTMGLFTRYGRDAMNMNWRIAMGNARAAGCVLVLFGSLALCAPSALGQPCGPVVYAFRHAEDTNPPGAHPPVPIFALTPTGKAHAAL